MIPTDVLKTAVDAHGSIRAAAKALNINESTIRRRFSRPAGVQEAMDSLGTDLEPDAYWKKNGAFSAYFRTPKEGDLPAEQVIQAAIDEVKARKYKTLPKGPVSAGGNLLVIDLADCHMGKLCVASATGYTYDRDVAAHRMIEGARALLAKARPQGIGRVLLVLGNDVLHVDNEKSTTTGGTYQDTHGTIQEIYADGIKAYTEIIEMLAAEFEVDLLYIPSNHDRLLGWALAGTVAAIFRNHPRVHASTYNLSSRPRKYYRFEQNLIGLSHADGEKDKDLYALMMTEARAHISECSFRYWYRHHLHHKIRTRDGLTPQEREKDHVGLTMIKMGKGMSEGDIEIEYVRSPSAPDYWHTQHGYVNRQAVECFIHEPDAGQTSRFTQWF